MNLEYNDFQKFALALDEYIQDKQECTVEQLNEITKRFQIKIQTLTPNRSLEAEYSWFKL